MPSSEGSAGVLVREPMAQAVLLDRFNGLRARATIGVSGPVGEVCAAALDALAAGLEEGLPAATSVTVSADCMAPALRDRRDLARIAVLRLGGPLTAAVPPLWTWPAELRAAVSVGETIVAGGAEYDGRHPAPLDADAVVRFLREIGDAVDAVAIVGVFSPMAAEHEMAAADLVRRELGDAVTVSLSHEIGTLGLLDRENATALNATLLGPARKHGAMLLSLLEAHGIVTEPYVTQNDGSAMALDHAMRYPVGMVGSGSASGMRGAAFLSGMTDCVVIEDDGEHTDVAVVAGGALREVSDLTEIAGVRTAIRRPLIVRLARAQDEGEGRAEAVRRELVASGVLRGEATGPGGTGRPATVVAVGSGARVVAEALDGRHGAEVVMPRDGDVAGAIGAAVALVRGEMEIICQDEEGSLRAAVGRARRVAIERAIHAGADPAVVDVVEVEQRPLSYLVESAVRVRVRAAGPRA
jgi:hypothetical protein